MKFLGTENVLSVCLSGGSCAKNSGAARRHPKPHGRPFWVLKRDSPWGMGDFAVAEISKKTFCRFFHYIISKDLCAKNLKLFFWFIKYFYQPKIFFRENKTGHVLY